ncbi:hypothetical protein PS862_05324 [Pseudomonas fluorescens]|uniref:Lipoprotein n=1 Tax=Pseudomonas fluorescens TaxID=294 RepID=A0A5E7PL66_PSEFL|nr:hypothetical protein PS639_00527 [Pseudomonas fluorescens]VVP49678.1 hypothetical protein PS862_05324 [Pseudomonas fluorescens]
MHGVIRAAGYSLMTMFVSCGVGAQDLDTRIGKIAMEGELPAHESNGKLYAELDFQQATQSYLWALPLVSYAQWQEKFRDKLGAQVQKEAL